MKPKCVQIVVSWYKHFLDTIDLELYKIHWNFIEQLINVHLLSCRSAHSQDLVITVPADVLAPNGARPSAGTLMTMKLDMALVCLYRSYTFKNLWQKCFSNSTALLNFHHINYRHQCSYFKNFPVYYLLWVSIERSPHVQLTLAREVIIHCLITYSCHASLAQPRDCRCN